MPNMCSDLQKRLNKQQCMILNECDKRRRRRLSQSHSTIVRLKVCSTQLNIAGIQTIRMHKQTRRISINTVKIKVSVHRHIHLYTHLKVVCVEVVVTFCWCFGCRVLAFRIKSGADVYRRHHIHHVMIWTFRQLCSLVKINSNCWEWLVKSAHCGFRNLRLLSHTLCVCVRWDCNSLS